MSWIVDALRTYARWTQNKVALPSYQTVEFDPATITLTDDPANRRIVASVSGSAALGDITVTSIVDSGDASIAGKIVQGPTVEVSGAATTVGAASATLLVIPIPANTLALTDYRYVAAYPAGYWQVYGAPDAAYQTGGSPGALGGSPTASLGNCGIAPSISSAYAGGILTITVTGPSLTITGIADNGAGKCRVTVGFLVAIDSALTGQSVTISGVVGTTEANGPHAATFVSATTFDLLTVNFVHAYVSGGAVVFTTPPTLKWVGRAVVTIAGP